MLDGATEAKLLCQDCDPLACYKSELAHAFTQRMEMASAIAWAYDMAQTHLEQGNA